MEGHIEMKKQISESELHLKNGVRRIYLMRHGEAGYFGSSGQPVLSGGASLTEKGRTQAQAAARTFSDVHFDKAIASGLARTVETAQIVLGGRDIPLEIREEFQEIRRGDLGALEEEALELAFTGVFRGAIDEERKFLGGETFGSLLDRVIPAMENLLEDTSWNTLLLTLHGAVNRVLLSYALTGERCCLGHFEQAPACINILDLNPRLEGRWIVRGTNIKPYDPLHLESRATSMEDLYSKLQRARKSAE